MRVVNVDGVELGVVDNMVATGANDVIVVKGEKEHWVPYIEPFLVSLNREERLITVDWDEEFQLFASDRPRDTPNLPFVIYPKSHKYFQNWKI